MRRTRIYKPRSGIRFDNRRIQGPAGGYVGSDLTVLTITGSVYPQVEQRYHSYSFSNTPEVIGYPRSYVELYKATGLETYQVWYLAWGIGFDVGGADDYASRFTVDGGGPGINTWVFPAFQYRSFHGTSTVFDMGYPWKAATTYRGNPTFITASSFEASPGPRGRIDVGIPPTFSGSAADTDYALRLMTTSSFIYTISPTGFWSTTYGTYGTVMVFKYMSDTTSFDVQSFGRLDMEGWSVALSMVTGNLRFSTTGSSQTFTSVSVPVDRDKWYIAYASSKNLHPDSLTVLGVIPFWGGQVVSASIGSFFPIPSSITASYIGDAGVLRASPDFYLSAFYMGPAFPMYGLMNGSKIDYELSLLQQAMSSPYKTTFGLHSAVDDSVATFGTDFERRYYNQRLLGLGTGALGRAAGLSTFATGSIPSWANSHIKNSAFVITTLSSSDHESQVLGYYRSGTEAVESSPVPASRSLYYSKKTIPYVDPGTGFSRTSAINYSRTYGVVLNTGTFDQNNYALICRLTGALADISGTAPGWFLNNRFGMPSVPDSSASLVPYVQQSIMTIHPSDILNVRPILDGARRLVDAARDASPAKTLMEQFDAALSGTTT